MEPARRTSSLQQSTDTASVDPHSDGHLDMDHAEHYAKSFSVQPGRCFRLVTSSAVDSQASPNQCANPVEFQGRFKDKAGKWHKVESCIDHAGDLTDRKRISSSAASFREAPSSPFRD